MNMLETRWRAAHCACLALIALLATSAWSQNTPDTAASSASSATSAADFGVVVAPQDEPRRKHRRHQHHDRELVSMGHDVQLAAGQQANTVVAIFGSASSDGEVERDVVSIMGNTRVTGPIGGNAVAVLGNTYVNSKVDEQVVAVLGDVELGPLADVEGQVIAVGGKVIRDPAAIVRGGVQDVSWGVTANNFAWLRPWIDQCLLYGRPLAIGPGLTWAWVIALLSLLSYVLTAWLAPRSVERCVTTLEQNPGPSLLAALLGAVLTPVLLFLLVVTVIGLLALPFVGLALLTIGMFGKLVMLAWLGRRATRASAASALGHMATVTLIGGVLVTLLYLVPVVGFIVYKLLGFVGFGVVLYAVLLHFKRKRAAIDGNVGGSTLSDDSQADSRLADGMSPPNHAARAEVNEMNADTLSILPRATFWVRMGALLLDVLLVGFVLGLIDRHGQMSLLALAIYGALMWKYKGTTIGGLVFHLQVVRVDGRALDWSTVIVRALSCFLSLLPAGLGFIWIAIDNEQQAWHDKIAGTVVVRTPKSESLV